MKKIMRDALKTMGIFSLGLLAICLSILTVSICTNFTRIINEYAWLPLFISSSKQLLIAFIGIWISKKGLKYYGFTPPVNVKWIHLGVVSFTASLMAVFYYSVAGSYLNYTLLPTVIFAWIYGPIAEEIFSRGFIQSSLSFLNVYKVTLFSDHLNLPVILASIFFMALHLPLLMMGMRILPMSIVLVIALIAGLIAGYYREKTGSLVPAIVIHIIFNPSCDLKK